MGRPMIAALLSGLVFPGIGHIYLKQYLRGVLFAAGAGFLLYWIVSVAVTIAVDITGQIQSGAVPLDTESISTLVEEQSGGSERSLNYVALALTAVWVVAIADAYRQGRAQEKAREMDNGAV